MDIELELFGVLRKPEPGDRMRLSVTGEHVAYLRAALVDHARAHWPRVSEALLLHGAYSPSSAVDHDHDHAGAER